MPASVPFFSIIVVCRNPGLHLQAALDTVWGQQEANYELVVIDGASTDGSREWLEARQEQITALIAEPDHGIYDAMNKGITAARGTWVYFLGADDRLASNNVLACATEALVRTDAGVVVGEATYDDTRVYRLAHPPGVVRRNFVHHQAAFYRRSLLTAEAGFDLGLQIMADYDFNLRLWKKGVRFESVQLLVARCASGGLSDAGNWFGYREEITVRHRYFPAWHCWFWDLGSVFRYLRKNIVRHSRPHG